MQIGSMVLTPGNKAGVVMDIGQGAVRPEYYVVEIAAHENFRGDPLFVGHLLRAQPSELIDDPRAAAVALARAEAEMIVGKIVKTDTVLVIDNASGQPRTLTLEEPIEVLIGKPDEDQLIRWTAADTLSPMYPCTPLEDTVESLAVYSLRGVRGRAWNLNGESALPDFCELVGDEPTPTGPSFR